MAIYVQPHTSQFDGSRYATQNCVPASLANGIAASTGGQTLVTGAQVRARLRVDEETNPRTAGWSMTDADRAMARMGQPFDNLSGQGWKRVKAEHEKGRYIVLQGDSDRFSNNTCSGVFDGDHCIGVHPATVGSRWWIDDPICRSGRWEEESVLLRYASKLDDRIYFGSFKTEVPSPPSFSVTIRAGATVRLYTFKHPPSGPVNCIEGWEDVTWGRTASSAPAGPAVQRKTCNGRSSATTAEVTAGRFAGRHIRVGARYGVTHSER